MRKYLSSIFICFIVLSVSGQSYKKLALADTLAMRNDYRGAIRLINEILDEKPRTFLKAQACFQLSHAYLQLYDLEKAYRYNEMSLALRDRIQYEFIADNYMRYGTIALLQGNLEEALDYFLEARDLPHESLQFSGILDGYIAAAYERLGKSQKALTFYRNSLEVLSWELESDHPDISVAHYNLGNFFFSTGEYIKAIEAYEKSVLIEMNTDWGSNSENPRLSRAYNALGTSIFKEKLDLPEAKKLFEAAIRASKGYPRLRAMGKLNLAQLFFVERKFELAEKTIEEALTLLNNSDEEDPRFFIPLIIDKKLYANGLQLKAEILFESFETNKNQSDLVKAFENSELAIEVFEGRFMDVYLEKSQLALLSRAKDIYEQNIFLGLKLFETLNDKQFLDKAFRSAERGKAQILKNQMQQFQSMLALEIPEATRKQERALRQKLQLLETDLGVKYEGDNFRKASLELHRQYGDVLKKLEQSAPEYYDFRYYLPDLSIEKIQNRLANDEVLISYYQGAELYYIFAISKNELDYYYNFQNAPLPEKSKKKIPTPASPEQMAKSGFPLPKRGKKKKDDPQFPKPDVGIYTKYTEKDLDLKTSVNRGMKGVIKLSKTQFVEASHALYRRLIEPVKDILKKKKSVIIVPHGDLHFVTFETLLKQKPKKKPKYHKLKYLIKDYSVAYLSSADFLTEQKSLNSGQSMKWVAFAPVFSPSDNLGYTLNAGDIIFDTLYTEADDLRALTPDRTSFKELEYSEKEVRSILGLLAKKGVEGKAFLKGEATEDALKKNQNNYNYLHLASHSFVNSDYPNLSGLALIESAEEDGILFAGEVLNQDFKNLELLVLSSCESGIGTLAKGEGLLSLNRAFQIAGVKSTVSTKWKISDKATARMMTTFYKKLLDGASHSAALRYAKLRMIKKSKTATPRLWAGFTLTGR